MALGAAAPWLRRNVGPTAWVVLEALAEHAVVDVDSTMSYRSVRDLAAELGLANDTVARALRRLADHHLVQHRAARSDVGRFAAGHYLLTLPPEAMTPMPPHDLESPSPRPTPRLTTTTTPNRRTTHHEQLDLLQPPTTGTHP